MSTKRLGESHAAIVRDEKGCHKAAKPGAVSFRPAESIGEIIVCGDTAIPFSDVRIRAWHAQGPRTKKIIDCWYRIPDNAIEHALHGRHYRRIVRITPLAAPRSLSHHTASALGYGGAVGRNFLLHKGGGSQCVQNLCRIDVVARVFIKKAGDDIQQLDVCVSPVKLDVIGVGQVPLQKLVKRSDLTEESGEVFAQIWQ
jgi:hypothetical protein